MVSLVGTVWAHDLRETLAGRPPCDQINGLLAHEIGYVVLVNFTDISRYVLRFEPVTVVREGSSRVFVNLNGVDQFKPRCFETNRQPSCTGEEVNVRKI